MFRSFLALLICLSCVACSKSGASSTDPSPTKSATKAGPPADPDRAMYEQVRSGTYQIGTAIDAIEEARNTVKKMADQQKGTTQKALLAIADGLDKAGEALSDYTEEPPTFEKFKADFAAQDDRRLKSINAASAAVDNLLDAQDIVGQLLASKPPEPAKGELESANSAIESCVATVTDAYKTLGGKLDKDGNIP